MTGNIQRDLQPLVSIGEGLAGIDPEQLQNFRGRAMRAQDAKYATLFIARDKLSDDRHIEGTRLQGALKFTGREGDNDFVAGAFEKHLAGFEQVLVNANTQ